MANTATAPAPIEEKPLTVEIRLGRNAVSDDTRNYVALAQKADSNRSVAWAVAVGSWLNDCTDDSGRLPVDIHGSVAKGDNVKCQTIKSKITEEFATTVGVTGSRVRQIVSGLYWHSGERGDPLNGFLKVNKRAPKGWESVGGCVTVNWGVLTSAIECEQFEVEKPSPNNKGTAVSVEDATTTKVDDTVRKLEAVTNLLADPKAQVMGADGKKETKVITFNATDKNKILMQAVKLIQSEAPEYLTDKAKAALVNYMAPAIPR